jgi:hypothetical protein
MLRKKSITVSEIMEILSRESQENFSGRLSIICDRYNEILKDETILNKFTDYEQQVLINKLDGRILKPAGLIRSLSKELSIGGQDLLEKLEKLSYVESVRLVEAIEKIIDEREKENGETNT